MQKIQHSYHTFCVTQQYELNT